MKRKDQITASESCETLLQADTVQFVDVRPPEEDREHLQALHPHASGHAEARASELDR